MKLLIAFQEPLKNALNEGINNYFPQVDREDFQTPYIKHTGDTQSSLTMWSCNHTQLYA